MKICPKCQQNYADDSLNFCLSDGSALIQKTLNTANQQTVFMNQPTLTNPAQPFSNQNLRANNSSAAAPHKSRTWLLWVAGIFGAIILLCGVGFIGLVALVGGDNSNSVQNRSPVANRPPGIKVNSNSIVNANQTAPKNILADDLSDWKLPTDTLGKTDYRDGELLMTSKSAEMFFVLISNKKNFRTDNAAAQVTVKNVTGKATDVGYGLVVHSDPVTAVLQDYAFLIDTGAQNFRIVKHRAKKETVVTDWTDSDAIKIGTEANVLKVADAGGKMTFFINGESVATIEDTDGIKSGVAGLYVGGAIPVAFSDLQIFR